MLKGTPKPLTDVRGSVAAHRAATVRERCLIHVIAVAGLLSVACFGAGSDAADAAMKNNRDGLRALIGKKADVTAAQADGTTALHWVARWDDLEMADLLIRAGADVKAA